MENTTELVENRTLSMHPKKFALWLFIVSVIMIFAAWTSAYIVRRAEGNWLEFDLPPAMLYSTIIIAFSSISMHWAFISAKKDNLNQIKIGLLITVILGAVFVYLQYISFSQLIDNQVWFGGKKSNPAGSFVYVLAGAHAVHIIGGALFLLITLYYSFANEVHSKKLLLIDMCTTFWHFLDVLWIYLYVFLMLYR
ncbi:MAG: cytochrome c oxidase subunit 3 [Cytophagales bacterium]